MKIYFQYDWTCILLFVIGLANSACVYKTPTDGDPLDPNLASGAELYTQLCVGCHGPTGTDGSSGISITLTDPTLLTLTITQRMPFGNTSSCTEPCASKIAAYITDGYPGAVAATPSASTIALHRLNRAEYDNTVRDLLLTESQPAQQFPTDDHGYGFDNIADVLSLSPLHLELMENSATTLAEQAALTPDVTPTTQLTEAETLSGTAGVAGNGFWNLYSNGSITAVYPIAVAGDYTFTARVWGTQASTEWVRMDLRLNGLTVQTVDVPNEQNNPGLFSFTTTLNPGVVEFGVAFLNDFYNPTAGLDRNLLVDWLQMEGPFNASIPDNPYRAQLYSCDPTTTDPQNCAQEIITNFAQQAWRRSVTAAETQSLLQLFNTALSEGDSFDVGIALALRGILISPHFIFRVELDPTSDGSSQSLSAYELANRLSYFLWSSMPDAQLMTLADNGQLLEKSVISEQVTRMLNDPKAQALVENFSGQWLQTRALQNVEPDYATYPAWDANLRTALQTESNNFFTHLMRADISMNQLLLADYSFIDSRLATHYEMSPPQTPFTQTTLPPNRRGLLTQGGFLTVTSHPTRTSIVKRGQWVLSNLLCSDPPPPPPGVEGLPSAGTTTGTLRERMEAHRSKPECISCHASMDPIGFGLEHFDAIGRWRDQDNFAPIDATGQLPDGTSFRGALELSQVIADDPRYAACVVEKLFTYALGRGPQADDEVYLDQINADWIQLGMTFKQLAILIAQSEPFTQRRTTGVAP